MQIQTPQKSKLQIQQNLIAILSGLIFGFGLGLSQMIDRQRVLGFLDIAGNWDQSLLFVLGGAVTVTVIAFRFVLQRSHPIWADQFQLPTRQTIDAPLVIGAAIFGLGWGIAGYCPGPAITALVLGHASPWLFLAGFVVGANIYRVWNRGMSGR